MRPRLGWNEYRAYFIVGRLCVTYRRRTYRAFGVTMRKGFKVEWFAW